MSATVEAQPSSASLAQAEDQPLATLDEEILRLLAARARSVAAPKFLVGFVIAGTGYGWAPTWIVLGWLVLFLGVAVVRSIYINRWYRGSGTPIKQRLRYAAMLSLISGIVNGLALTMFPYLPELHRAVQTTVFIGLCAAAVASTTGLPSIFFAYLVPTAGSLMLAWLFVPGPNDPGWMGPAIALLLLVLSFVLAQLARDSFNLLRESFAIRLEQVETNRQLRAALVSAEAANRAKTRFLAAASHDLRQPMHALSLLFDALTLRPLDEQGRELSGYMKEALTSLAVELDALLDVSKLDAGVVQIEPKTIDLQSFLARYQYDALWADSKKQLSFSMECPPNIRVRSDETALDRILRNLLDNAFKYTDHGGVTLTVSAKDQEVEIAVSDTGRGIPSNEHERVFEEFYQLENPERDRVKGLGLGLSIVKRLVHLLNHRLTLESNNEGGCTFRLFVARAQSSVETSSDAQLAQRVDLRGKRILVVEDELQVRIATRELLEASGFVVALADSMDDALRQDSQYRSDVVLADLRLRGTDTGLRTIEALRARRPSLAALLITGDTAPDRLREVADAGIPVLHKPLNAQSLRRAIEDSLLHH